MGFTYITAPKSIVWRLPVPCCGSFRFCVGLTWCKIFWDHVQLPSSPFFPENSFRKQKAFACRPLPARAPSPPRSRCCSNAPLPRSRDLPPLYSALQPLSPGAGLHQQVSHFWNYPDRRRMSFSQESVSVLSTPLVKWTPRNANLQTRTKKQHCLLEFFNSVGLHGEVLDHFKREGRGGKCKSSQLAFALLCLSTLRLSPCLGSGGGVWGKGIMTVTGPVVGIFMSCVGGSWLQLSVAQWQLFGYVWLKFSSIQLRIIPSEQEKKKKSHSTLTHRNSHLKWLVNKAGTIACLNILKKIKLRALTKMLTFTQPF